MPVFEFVAADEAFCRRSETIMCGMLVLERGEEKWRGGVKTNGNPGHPQ